VESAVRMGETVVGAAASLLLCRPESDQDKDAEKEKEASDLEVHNLGLEASKMKSGYFLIHFAPYSFFGLR
jgi:hypothetical protein